MRKLVLLGIVLAAVYFGAVEKGIIPRPQESGGSSTPAEHALATAFEDRQSDLEVHGSGRVTRVLPDDTDGSRHQRFLVQVTPSQTVLVAHNIDLADRIDSLRTGDSVEFKGEYEWNAQGGVVHWTHRDPRGSHVDGWIRHNGRTYH